MQENDASYYRRRAEAQTRLAERAKRPDIAAAHYQLASLYLDQLQGPVAPEATSGG